MAVIDNHLHVEAAWIQAFTGCGVTVAIVDNGEATLNHHAGILTLCVAREQGIGNCEKKLQRLWKANTL